MIRKIFSVLCLASLFASCAKELDIQPLQSITEELALNTDAKVKKVLNGTYDAASSGSLWGGDLQLYSELMAANGEIAWEGTFNQPDEIWKKSILTTNSYVRDTWLQAYATINNANNVLSAISVVNAADQNRVKGEAMFIRGAMYFELVKLFAKPYSAGSTTSNKGVPLITTPTRVVGSASNVARSSVEETYTQILSDLTTAEGLVSAKNDVYANKALVAGMLSRVYLQMGKYVEARDAANRAITSALAQGYALTSTYSEAFNNASNSSEDFFAMQVTAQDGANDMHLFWSIPDYGGRDGDVSIQTKHLNMYALTDARLYLFYDGAGATRSGKWKYNYSNLPVMRLAELYLTRAEANFRLVTSVGATPLDDVNRIRTRANLSTLPILTLADILKERKLELAHEGQALHDLKRTKGSADGFAYDADKMVFPIPQREVDASAGVIVQNSGY